MTRTTALLIGLVAMVLLISVASYFCYPWDDYAAAQGTGMATEHLVPLQGRWEHLSWKADGPPIATGWHFTIHGNIVTYTIKSGSTGFPAYYYAIDALDATQDPPWIDWTAINNARTARKTAFRQRGVYRLDGDTLIIRLSRPGESRPRENGMEPDQGDTVYILKRATETAP